MERPFAITDGDGHLRERDEELYPYLVGKYPIDVLRNYYLFPDLDGRRRTGRPGDGHDSDSWQTFLDTAGIAGSVLYPTAGLAFALCRDREWARDLARAYNRFVHDAYLRQNPNLRAVALLPVQDPPAAADELEFATKQLGMVAGLLPAPGLSRPYGDPIFDPLYQRAQALHAPLAVHGASKLGLGFDNFDLDLEMPRNGGFVLAHPFAQMTQFTNMVCQGVFHRFPDLKVAYLEAGCGWVPFLLERTDRRMSRLGKYVATDQVRNSPIYFHAELDEPMALAYVSGIVGEDRLLYASDYPHEPHEEVIEDLETFLGREDVPLPLKQKLLHDNITAFYSLA